MLVSYNWLKEYIGDQAPSPEEIGELLTRHSFEVEEIESVGDDVRLTIDVLPNRSSDCLSHRGIAKEIAAISNIELAVDPLRTPAELPKTDQIAVHIEDVADCPRFTAALLTGITVTESPQWLQDRLQAIGQRSINNIVDATNYVMYATGQPLHAYDAKKFPQVDGKWQFCIRKAKVGEVVSLLSEGGKDEERDIALQGTELLVVDASSDTPIGLAGVKGGRFAGVDAQTTSIIIEAAHFDAGLTRQTARRLGIVIDASKRFENEPSRELPQYAQAEIVSLITKIAGGDCQGWVDVYPAPVPLPEVSVRISKVNALLGLTLSKSQMIDIVQRLGATVTETEEGFRAVSPFERTDLHIEEDYIEEIGRIYGVAHIAPVVPDPIPLVEVNRRQYYSEALRHALMNVGFNEVITSSFRKKDTLRLANALASDKQYMRSSLRKNIETVLTHNVPYIDLIGATDVRVFEIGTVFTYDEQTKQISEHTALTIGVRTKHSGYTPKDDTVLEAGITAAKTILGEDVAFVVEHGVAELNLSAVLESLPEPAAYAVHTSSAAVTYQPLSPYPPMSRDIAMWVGEGTAATAVAAVLQAAAPKDLLARLTHLDTFTKDGRTSLAFRLVFQSHERTLTSEEIDGIMDAVYEVVTEQGWEVR